MLEVELERCVLLCNSCVLDRGVLFSDNPDEVALLRGARESGSVLLQKHDEKVEIRVGGGVAPAARDRLLERPQANERSGEEREDGRDPRVRQGGCVEVASVAGRG